MLVAPYEREEYVLNPPELLIVSNDPNIRLLLPEFFEPDYALVFAEVGGDALEALRQQTIDLILLDVTMPDSFDILRDIRASEAGTTTRVVMISTPEDNDSIVRGLQLGATDYITKPLDVHVARARVSTQMALQHAEDERQQTISHLKFTQEMQENFARIVSHDLKGPLTNIRMAQFMLRDILRDNPEASNILDNMDVTLNGMIDMIRVFLDAMDAQQLEPTLEAVEVHDLVVEIFEQYRLSAERKQIQLSMRGCDRQVTGDQRLLRQVLNNLVSNAVKFSPADTQTSVWTETKDGMVRICVADGGPGIPAEEHDQLFSMFSKLSPRPTGGETSTGLGLWIVKELTELQKGRVGVDQPATGGSLFWIELPSATPEA
jgi:two-component system sensor histidine kinase/response regulator